MSAPLTAVANAAAQWLGVLDSGESLSAQQFTDALTVANNLLLSWWQAEVLSINIQISSFSLSSGVYTPIPVPQFPDTTTAITLPVAYDRLLRLALAVELAPQYDTEPSSALVASLAEARQAVNPKSVAAVAAKGGMGAA